MAAERLDILSTPFLSLLERRVAENVSAYKAADSWLDNVDFSGPRAVETEIELDRGFEFVAPEGKSKHNDAANAIAIHRQLHDLSPAIASNPRLWAYLSHVRFWKYMRARWPVERVEGEKAVRFIEERYFVRQSQGRALLRQGISRLWWAAHLTFDPQRDEPYELTPILLSKLDITKNLLERSFGRSRSVLIGFLEFLKGHEDELLTAASGRAKIRQLSKALNLAGGVSLLDALEPAEVSQLLEQTYMTVVPAEGEEDEIDDEAAVA